ncbi:MAG: hypothetical protein HYY95_16830 [Candidatus Rokubacteria bacterium]|nr:hypothetical protein [Candidatus Rokubacteria bacterium]
MTDDERLALLRRRAQELLGRLGPAEREALLVKCWMAHDARWFAAAAREGGIALANRLNRMASREAGRVEARRIAGALGLPPVRSADDWILTQEALIGLLGPDLIDYRVSKEGESACRMSVERCFAHDQVTRAGMAAEYECGVFERVAGWLDALGVRHQLAPTLGRCLKAQGRECAYTITLGPA